LKASSNSQFATSNLKSNQSINQLADQLLSRRELISQRLLSLTLVREELQSQFNEHSEYLPHEYLMILNNLSEGKSLEDERLVNILNLLHLRSSFELQTLGEENIEEEFQELLRQLRLEFLKERRQLLSRLLREAEENKEDDKIAEVLKEFDEISKLIHNS